MVSQRGRIGVAAPSVSRNREHLDTLDEAIRPPSGWETKTSRDVLHDKSAGSNGTPGWYA